MARRGRKGDAAFTATRWAVDDTGQCVLTLNRGQRAPWDPATPWDERDSYRWQLPLGPDADGRIPLPDPATFERHPWRAGEDQPHRDDATGPRDPSAAEQQAIDAAEDACARPGPAVTGDPPVVVTDLPDGFVQRDTAVDTGQRCRVLGPVRHRRHRPRRRPGAGGRGRMGPCRHARCRHLGDRSR